MSGAAIAVVVVAGLAGWLAFATLVCVVIGRAIAHADRAETRGLTVPDEMPEEWRR